MENFNIELSTSEQLQEYISKLLLEKNKLKKENEELKEQLHKYTNPQRNKNYQERNKEKLKEYQKKYYENKKNLVQKV